MGLRRFKLQRDGETIAEGIETDGGKVVLTQTFDSIDAATAAFKGTDVTWGDLRGDFVAALKRAGERRAEVKGGIAEKIQHAARKAAAQAARREADLAAAEKAANAKASKQKHRAERPAEPQAQPSTGTAWDSPGGPGIAGQGEGEPNA